MTRGLLIVCLGASLLALGCESDADAGDGARQLAQRLSDSVAFRLGALIPSDLPSATDDAVSLVELGPATLLSPGGSELLAFEVVDPQGRAVTATLLQFVGEESHLRGMVEESGGSTGNVVTNVLDVRETLCEGLCDGVLSIDALVAVELEGGAISTSELIEIAIDCRGAGTEGECPIGSGTDSNAPALICDNVTLGGAALTNDAQLDAYFDAMRTLSIYSKQTRDSAEDALAKIRTALGPDALSDGIPPVLESRVAEATEAGLLVLVGNPGCAVRAPRVQHTLRVCDQELTAETASMACSGLCEPGIDRNACVDAEGTGCRGVTQEGACAGTCIGACQVMLDEPRACVGTCIGTCDGTCDNEQGGACDGPCAGLCDGECREPVGEGEATCDGLCTGFCDETTTSSAEEPLPVCGAPLQPYCSSAEGSTLVCRGDCFGDASLAAGTAICQASALAIGQLSARCDPPIVQIYFAYRSDADMDTQDDFAALVADVNNPLTTLLLLLDRVELLEAAASGLLTVAQGPVAERVAEQLNIQPESLECAQTVVDTTTPWLQEEVDTLQDLRDEILAIAEVLVTTGL